MNIRSRISLAALAVVSTVAALASAQQECEEPLDEAPLASEQAPLECQFNNVVAQAFARVQNGEVTLVVDMIGDGASFADTLGYDADGRTVGFCQAIDTNPNAGPNARDEEENPEDCDGVVSQDLAIEFNEG
jgi:hypothetical protein